MTDSRRRVLISEPNAAGGEFAFLPYVWAILKSYWEHHGSDPEAFSWLDPIFARDAVASDLQRYDSAPPDVLGLSCYTWNWDLQRGIARWAKERNPQCLVVAGGPDPDYKDPDFFRKHPYIDAIVVQDGEIPFTAILETLLAGGRDFHHIPGLYLPRLDAPARLLQGPASPHNFTGRAEVPTQFDHSPYLEQSEFYERILAARGAGTTNAIWETNRGCPYGCSFCDWGSATLSKVRKFDLARIEAESDWLGRMGIRFLFVADANFGILPRDVDIADCLVAAKARYGHPYFMYYSSAKNNPERTVDIARRTYAGHLTSTHTLSVQHTDPRVLAATDRSNIPAAKYREVVGQLIELGIPSDVQLIVGIPGDTPATWRECLGEIMDWGVHDNYHTFPYALLPNAPASEPGYREKWRLETVERWMSAEVVRRTKDAVDGYAKCKVVVACRSYTREDWVDMSTYAALVRTYHNRAITRVPAIYLRFVHDVSYREFYGALIDEFCPENNVVAPLYRQVRANYERFLVDPNASDNMELEDVPDYPYLLDASRWLFVETCLQLDAFYAALSQFLSARFPQATALASAIDYQKNLVMLPDYDRQRGKSFAIDRDWPGFIREATRLTRYRPLDEPAGLGTAQLITARIDESRGPHWVPFDGASADERRFKWIDQIVSLTNNSSCSNLSPVRAAAQECVA